MKAQNAGIQWCGERGNVFEEPNPSHDRIQIGMFGKHPAWDGFFSVGLESDILARVRSDSLVQAMSESVLSDVWDSEDENVVQDMSDRFFIWDRLAETVVGLGWPSEDSEGQPFPVFVCVEIFGQDRMFTVPILQPHLLKLQKQIKAAESLAQVKSARENVLSGVRQAVRDRNISDMTAKLFGETEAIVHVAKSLGEETSEELERVFYKIGEVGGHFLPDVYGEAVEKGIPPAPVSLRLPRPTKKPFNAARIWIQFFRSQIGQTAPVLLLAPVKKHWVHAVLGEANEEELYYPVSALEEIPLVTEVTYEMGESFRAEVRKRVRSAESERDLPLSIFDEIDTEEPKKGRIGDEKQVEEKKTGGLRRLGIWYALAVLAIVITIGAIYIRSNFFSEESEPGSFPEWRNLCEADCNWFGQFREEAEARLENWDRDPWLAENIVGRLRLATEADTQLRPRRIIDRPQGDSCKWKDREQIPEKARDRVSEVRWAWESVKAIGETIESASEEWPRLKTLSNFRRRCEKLGLENTAGRLQTLLEALRPCPEAVGALDNLLNFPLPPKNAPVETASLLEKRYGFLTDGVLVDLITFGARAADKKGPRQLVEFLKSERDDLADVETRAIAMKERMAELKRESGAEVMALVEKEVVKVDEVARLTEALKEIESKLGTIQNRWKDAVNLADKMPIPRPDQCLKDELGQPKTLSQFEQKVEGLLAVLNELKKNLEELGKISKKLKERKEASDIVDKFANYFEGQMKARPEEGLERFRDRIQETIHLGEELVGFLEGEWRNPGFAGVLFLKSEDVSVGPEGLNAYTIEAWLKRKNGYYWLEGFPATRQQWEKDLEKTGDMLKKVAKNFESGDKELKQKYEQVKEEYEGLSKKITRLPHGIRANRKDIMPLVKPLKTDLAKMREKVRGLMWLELQRRDEIVERKPYVNEQWKSRRNAILEEFKTSKPIKQEQYKRVKERIEKLKTRLKHVADQLPARRRMESKEDWQKKLAGILLEYRKNRVESFFNKHVHWQGNVPGPVEKYEAKLIELSKGLKNAADSIVIVVGLEEKLQVPEAKGEATWRKQLASAVQQRKRTLVQELVEFVTEKVKRGQEFSPQQTRERVSALADEFEKWQKALGAKLKAAPKTGPHTVEWANWEQDLSNFPKRLRYVWRDGQGEVRHELAFERVEPKEGKPAYLCTTEVSVGLFVDVIEQAKQWENFHDHLHKNDIWMGPKPWRWAGESKKKIRPATGKEKEGWLPMDIVTVPASWNPYPEAVKIVPPGKESPINYISAQGAQNFASLLGCDLPKPSWWKVAYERGKTGKKNVARRWNLRDQTCDEMRKHIISEPPSVPEMQKSLRIFEQMSPKKIYQWNDGTLWFDPVESREIAPVYHLRGNVAELVKSGSVYYVMGESALSPRSGKPEKKYQVKENAAYMDVGFRLGLPAGGDSATQR
ncbi:MAG: hypothetical protein ACLFWL_04920 [Candidatus Brocadiia bacterium]